MTDLTELQNKIQTLLTSKVDASISFNELTLTVRPFNLYEVCLALRDDSELNFNMLIDICGVDYLHYGISEWETNSSTTTGFERGVDKTAMEKANSSMPRFAVIYHLLSLSHNHRVRLRVYLDDVEPMVSSVIDIWPSADWFEREAYDLFGIIFSGHPDLRRLLTDYGFVGHPFRKDFPLIGKVEARYDAKQKRVIYEPVSIQPRVLEPKVIRKDTRYLKDEYGQTS